MRVLKQASVCLLTALLLFHCAVEESLSVFQNQRQDCRSRAAPLHKQGRRTIMSEGAVLYSKEPWSKWTVIVHVAGEYGVTDAASASSYHSGAHSFFNTPFPISLVVVSDAMW